MFCPNCNAEYRQGFTRCSDCSTELVETTRINTRSGLERPDEAPSKYFLAWFLPMSLYLDFYFGVMSMPSLAKNGFVIFTLVVSTFSCNIGAFWMMYQAIRYEERVKRYFFLAWIPFIFIWYRIVRYPIRPKLVRKARTQAD